MADFAYTRAKRNIALGDIHFDTDDFRVILLMTNTTADTEKDKATINDFGTLDEFDGSGYTTATGASLANEAVNEDAPNDRAEFDADNLTFGSISAGTRNIQGMIVLWWSGTFATSVPVLWIDSGGFPFTANGGDLVIAWNAEGIAQIT